MDLEENKRKSEQNNEEAINDLKKQPKKKSSRSVVQKGRININGKNVFYLCDNCAINDIIKQLKELVADQIKLTEIMKSEYEVLLRIKDEEIEALKELWKIRKTT